MANGVPLPIATNGLSALCEVIASARAREQLVDEFFSERVFQEKRKELLLLKPNPLFSSHLQQLVFELFPIANLHYICGSDMPIATKMAVFKQRVITAVVSGRNNVEEYKIVVPFTATSSHSLEQMMNHFQQNTPSHIVDRNEMGLLFDVEYVRGNGLVSPIPPVKLWLSRVFEKMFPSEYFKINSADEYALVNHNEPTYDYVCIGQLLGLALMNSVPIGVTIDKKLLRELLSDSDAELERVQIDVLRLRRGFYEVLSATALWGTERTPKKFFTQQELSALLRNSANWL